MPIAKFHKQRRVVRGTWKARFTKQRQNWRNSTKAAATPTVASIAPATVVKLAAATTVTLTGTGFVSGVTKATLNGGDVTTTYISATSISCVIPASALTTAKTIAVSAHSGLLVAPTARTFTVTDVE
jgi:hypothetical protein